MTDPIVSADWHFDATRVVVADEVAYILAANSAPVFDARPADRFAGQAPEPRPGLRSGHMPGAVNMPFQQLTLANGGFATEADLRETLSAELGDTQPVVTCGSGMTACILALGFARIGVAARLYDGSWAEWGGDARRPVVTDTL